MTGERNEKTLILGFMGFQGCCGCCTHLRMERTLRCYLGGEGMNKKGRAQLVDVCRLPNDRQDTGRKEGLEGAI